MIKNSSYINHQKDTTEIKSFLSQVDKTSENKLVDFSAKTLPYKIFCTALWNLPLNVSDNLDFFIYQREQFTFLGKSLIAGYIALITSPFFFPFQSTISSLSFSNFIHHSLFMN